MTEQGKPLSRRERRALEARAAGAEAPTEALVNADEDPAPPTDGLSRRDRRRIERSRQPMEIWTAEEEMLATGQLPAMTPDRIAEQERIAQQKAAEAAADAAAAVAALGLASQDVADGDTGDAADATPPVRESAFARVAEAPQIDEDGAGDEQGTEPEALPMDEDGAGDEQGTEAEASDQDDVEYVTPAWLSGEAPTPEHVENQSVELEHAEPERPAADQTEAIPADADQFDDQQFDDQQFDDQPLDGGHGEGEHGENEQRDHEHGENEHRENEYRDSEHREDEQATPDVVAEPSSELETEPQDDAPTDATFDTQFDDDEIPAAFRGMFPPGSLQAQAAAARRQEAAERADAQQDPDSAIHAGASGAAADEIRKLTAAAMAGIESSSHRTEEAVSDTQVEATDGWGDPGSDETVAEFGDGAELAGVSYDHTDTDDVVTEQNAWQTPSEPDQLEPAPASADIPVSTYSDPSDGAFPDPTFDEVIATRSGEVPLVELRVDPEESLAPEPAELPTVAPSIWDSHPLEGANSQTRELADAPSQAIPRPDFSQLAPATNPEHPAPFDPTAYSTPPLDAEAPLTTGTIEVARRKVPELHPAGGARHFRWAHIAVIGAIAFVLGVLVWNLAGQS